MTEKSSHRQILRSSVIIGGSSVINILIGLLRIKIVAVLLGPAGIGLISLLQSLMATTAQVSALGLGNAGTRQVAQATESNDQARVDEARRALFWGTLVLAVIGALVIWLLRVPLAAHVLRDDSLAPMVGWLAVGVALTIAAGSQTALLTGMRRIGDIARAQIGTALLSTLFGVGAIWWLGERGLVPFVLSVPLLGFIVSFLFVARLPRVSSPRTPLSLMVGQWKTMVRLGFAIMLAGVVEALGQLATRTIIQRGLGAAELGYFQASWTISMTYLGFVLGAMGTDYYPRLVAAVHDRARAIRLVNEQTEVALLLAGPALLAVLGLVPWVIHLLYSEAFIPATTVLRWQLVGDILKVISWPMGFVIIAAGKGGLFVIKQALVTGVLVVGTWLLLPHLQIEAAGVAFLAMYIVNVPALLLLSHYVIGFKWQSHIKWEALALLVCGALVAFVGHYHDLAGAALGLLAAAVFGVRSLLRLSHMADIGGRIGQVAKRIQGILNRLGIRY